MDQDATWYEDRSRPRRHCVRWGPSSSSQTGGRSPLPNFRPMSIVAKWLDGSRWYLAWRWSLVHVTLCWMGIQLSRPPPNFRPIFTARRNASIASAVLAIAIPSVCLSGLLFTARRNARIASAVLGTAIPSVCPYVRHTPVLCQNDGT